MLVLNKTKQLSAFDTAQDTFGFLGCQPTLPAHVQLLLFLPTPFKYLYMLLKSPSLPSVKFFLNIPD